MLEVSERLTVSERLQTEYEINLIIKRMLQ